MRNKAKRILYKKLKEQGSEAVLFSSGKLSDSSGLIDTVVDAMVEFKVGEPEKIKKKLSLQDCKEEFASHYDKTWYDIKRDYDLAMGVSKLMSFEECMDMIAEMYHTRNK